MELPVLDRFCFVINLRTGCIVMGIINSVLTLCLGVALSACAADLPARGTQREEDAALSSVVYTIVVLLVVLLFLKLLLDIIFVYAVYKEKSGIMKNYCIFWIVFLVLFIIGFLKTLFHMGAGYVIAQILFLAENIYYIVVIRSYLISIHEDGVL